MKYLFLLLLCVVVLPNEIYSNNHWTAKRITARESQNQSNSWINFVKIFETEEIPQSAIARIACDSKYWLWINGELVVFEGQLKRGPTPKDTYFDEVDITKFLREGKNRIGILVWYFGKDGFSHNSSGQSGLVFQCEGIGIKTDESWLSKLDKGYENTSRPYPNFRLSESNVRFDARKGNFAWVELTGSTNGFRSAKVLGEAESEPWNKLVKRPIPLFKDYGIRPYENNSDIPSEGTGEWIICKLPYNCHVSPIFNIEAPADITIKMQTDNFDYMGLGKASVRAEYVTKKGTQQYESLGWMNGHVVKYLIPKGVKINSLSYRESGFGCEFTGWFKTNDKFYERLWEKAVRTLYVTMRDTYMDCPDRERAQWWGDMVNESGEAFYALSPEAATITEKGILELINWQREDGTIYSPIPEGNWNKELPGQMLASIGYYGFWNYYMNTGDKETMAKVYKGVKRYLDVWNLKDNGTLVHREGEWYWGDWGKEVDKQLLFNGWYYLALKGYLNMSELFGETAEAQQTQKAMAAFKTAFNTVFWDGKGYRTAEYEGKYDDRAQALAVVSGLAGKDKYDELLEVFKSSYLASPYMEKYVLEALFVMEEAEFGLERMKSRYYKMVDVSPWTTLYENFGDGVDRAGHGTNNHAWSGGGLTILAQYVCGLYPIEPAWKSFMIKPQLGNLEFAETGNITEAGRVAVTVRKVNEEYIIDTKIPKESKGIICIPKTYRKIELNEAVIWSKKEKKNPFAEFVGLKDGYHQFMVNGGTWKFTASK